MRSSHQEYEDFHPASEHRQKTPLLICTFLLLLMILSACFSLTSIPSPTADSTIENFSLPPAWTETASLTRDFYYDTMVHMATLTDTLAATEFSTTETIPSRTPTSIWTATNTLIPTSLPTPTRGLPPTFTPGPKETCPAPTHAKVDIHFVDNIWDYGSQIVDYLRANGNSTGLKEKIEKLAGYAPWDEAATKEPVEKFKPHDVKTFLEDVTGDLSRETIVTLQQYGAEGFDYVSMFVVGCRNHQYQLLNADGGVFGLGIFPFSKGPNEIMTIMDINTDGIREILFTITYYTGSAHGDVEYFYYVFEWDGDLFRSLFPEDEGKNMIEWSGQESMNLQLELKDIDKNGTTELLFPYEYIPMCGTGPARVEKEVYMWDGEYYRDMWTDPGVPVYRFQAAFDGDYYALISLYDKSEASYRKAIDDPSLEPYVFTDYICADRKNWEPDDPQTIIAYARFRRMELLAFLEQETESEIEWKQLMSDFPEQAAGHQYAFLANIFWEAYKAEKNIDDACAAVRNEAAKQPDPIFDPIYFGYANPGPSLETICPFTAKSSG